jgi:hypothetical protein
MQYRVIGTDGREYGPVTGEQVRAWIADTRVNARTPVRTEAGPDWKPLGLWPEFQAFVAPEPLPSARQVFAADAGRRTNALAIWGLVCGILSFTCCQCCCVPVDLVGIVLSVIAIVQINNRRERENGMPLAIAGLVLCVLSFLGGLALSGWWLFGGGESFLRSLESLPR